MKKKGIPWWLIPAAVAGICGLGLVGAAFGNNNDTKEVAATTTRMAAPAAPVFSAPAAPAVPTTTKTLVQDIAIPDVVGKNGAVATDELKRAGFTKISYGSATPGVEVVLLASNWTVTAIEPGPGTVISSDSTIVLTMKKNNR